MSQSLNRSFGAWAIALAWILVLTIGSPVYATTSPSSVVSPSGARLPACGTYADVITPRAAYSDWQSTLVDTTYRVARSYVPPDLVLVSKAHIGGSGKVRALMIDDLAAMAQAARAAGHPIAAQSAYRSYATQVSVFNSWVRQLGRNQALKVSARPGHSEHQLGLAIDFKSKGGKSPWNYANWAATPAGRWMMTNAWKYGFVLSYRKGATSLTCYGWEPWHYRYFGREQAAATHASGLTTREYLWNQGSGDTSPTPTPKPSPTSSPTPSPTSSPT